MDPATPLSEAAKHSWEAALLVFIIVGVCGTTAWLLKHWITQATVSQQKEAERASMREERLSQRITRLEDFVETTLMQTVASASQVMKDCTGTLTELQQTLQHTRPCLWTGDSQRQHVQLVADLLAERLIMLFDQRTVSKGEGGRNV